MPEGQYSGIRKTYEYTADDGNIYLLKLDETLGDLTECALSAATTATTGTAKPLSFKPRIVYWQGTLNGRTVRKSLVCDPDATIYQSNTSQAVTIDGVAGFTTGRRGEKFSFTILPSP